MCDKKEKRFFNVRITVSDHEGVETDPSIPFDPIPWLKNHINMMEDRGLNTGYFPQFEGLDGAVINTASFPLK